MDKNSNYEAFRQLCAAHGYKCTPQRLAVYGYIRENASHPTVDQIWTDVKHQIPSITRESVFRILTELAELGLVYRMDRIINARFDGFPHNHGHFICDKCGAIMDFELPKDLPAPGAGKGFQASHMELRISGSCAACSAAEQENPPGNAKKV